MISENLDESLNGSRGQNNQGKISLKFRYLHSSPSSSRTTTVIQ